VEGEDPVAPLDVLRLLDDLCKSTSKSRATGLREIDLISTLMPTVDTVSTAFDGTPSASRPPSSSTAPVAPATPTPVST